MSGLPQVALVVQNTPVNPGDKRDMGLIEISPGQSGLCLFAHFSQLLTDGYPGEWSGQFGVGIHSFPGRFAPI